MFTNSAPWLALVAVDLVWATAAGLALGSAFGWGFGRRSIYRRHEHNAFGMESFLTLGLIARPTAWRIEIAVYGFLAVFAAGLSLRHVRGPAQPGPARGFRPHPRSRGESGQIVGVHGEGAADFTLDLEKLAELAVMLIIGSLAEPAQGVAGERRHGTGLIFVRAAVGGMDHHRPPGAVADQRRYAAGSVSAEIGSLVSTSPTRFARAADAQAQDMRRWSTRR